MLGPALRRERSGGAQPPCAAVSGTSSATAATATGRLHLKTPHSSTVRVCLTTVPSGCRPRPAGRRLRSGPGEASLFLGDDEHHMPVAAVGGELAEDMEDAGQRGP